MVLCSIQSFWNSYSYPQLYDVFSPMYTSQISVIISVHRYDKLWSHVIFNMIKLWNFVDFFSFNFSEEYTWGKQARVGYRGDSRGLSNGRNRTPFNSIYDAQSLHERHYSSSLNGKDTSSFSNKVHGILRHFPCSSLTFFFVNFLPSIQCFLSYYKNIYRRKFYYGLRLSIFGYMYVFEWRMALCNLERSCSPLTSNLVDSSMHWSRCRNRKQKMPYLSWVDSLFPRLIP